MSELDTACSAGMAPPREDCRSRTMLAKLDRLLLNAEEASTALLIAAIFIILAVNVVLRSLGMPLIWADEAAILLMACAAFLGAAVALARGQHMAVTLLLDSLPQRLRFPVIFTVDVITIGFFLILSALCWRWFDPVNAFGAESLQAYSQQTFNFIYQERTLTLGLNKVWFWLVLPLFAVLSTIHALAALERDVHHMRSHLKGSVQ
ncbi:MAG: TRAP transporter small permease [Rhizobium sp.]|nr:TRAP transporter small permease [Rhizobium sp.]MBW8318425.1 TRAP transporter small permease [Rhizobium sp.]MBW8445340.1 TRAP transporter small permease [Arenimonas sp.]